MSKLIKCIPERKHHQWRVPKTRGKPHNGDRCFWCGLLWEDRKEKPKVIEMEEKSSGRGYARSHKYILAKLPKPPDPLDYR